MAAIVDVPPPYDLDAPPSYESVVGKIDTLVKNYPTCDGAMKAFNGLSDSEKKVLISHDLDGIHFDPEQEKRFRRGFAEAFAKAKDHLKWDAEGCANFCKKVAQDFLDVKSKLSSLAVLDGERDSKKLLADFTAL